MSDNKKPNVQDLLNAIKDANKDAKYTIWVPSLNRNVLFKYVTTGQQKAMIQALVDNPVYNTNFIIALYELLTENCLEANIQIDQLYLHDKIAIMLQLRSQSVGNKVIVQNDGEEITVQLDTLDYTTHFNRNIELERTIAGDNIVLTCKMPTIGREVALERELRAKLKSAELKDYNDIRNVLADAYIGELAKCIYCIKLGEMNIDLSTQTYANAYTIIESLPANLVKNVVTYLESIQKTLNELVTISGMTTKGELTPVQLTLDAAFFVGK